MNESPRVKGVSFRSMLGALARLRGDDVVSQTIQILPEDVREAVQRGSIVAGGWYDLEWYKALHRAARTVTRSGRELPRGLSRDARLADFTGIYRVFAVMLSPESLLSKGPRAFHRYYDNGAMRVVEARAGMASAAWSECFGFDGNVWETVIGGAMGALEASGARNVRVRVLAGGTDGDSALKLEARWA